MKEPPIERLPTEARDLALGHFMDEWSQLEARLRSLLGSLAGTHFEVGFAIGSAIPDLGRMQELLQVLGDLQLKDAKDRKELKKICDYLIIQIRYRNSIVHGQWLIRNSRKRGPEDHLFEWVRVYSIIGRAKEMAAVLGRDEKGEEKWVFTIDRLNERSAKTKALSERIRKFLEGIHTRVRFPERLS
jgi:hypothetical protein